MSIQVSFQVWVALEYGFDLCGEYDDPLDAVVQTERTHWCEGEAESMVIMAQGRIVACMVRDDKDFEICHTQYSDGRHESHRCHYVLDDGEYVRTEITEVTAAAV
jgi:hypothetical protein